MDPNFELEEEQRSIPSVKVEKPVEEVPDGFRKSPALLQYCEEVWTRMHSTAQPEVLGPNGEVFDVWEGFLTKLFTGLGLSTPYYSHVTKLLIAMDCARQLKRGGGSSPSKWVLIQAPSVDLYYSKREAIPSKFDGSTQDTAQQQQIRDLNKRLSELERQVEWHLNQVALHGGQDAH